METVAVVHPNDPAQRMVINQTDYDPARHVLWPAVAPQAAPAPESIPGAAPALKDIAEAKRGPGRPKGRR